MDDIKRIEDITKLSFESQNQNLRHFIKFDTPTRLKILRKEKTIFHTLKDEYTDVSNVILSYASHILAIERTIKELNNVNLNVSKLRAKTIKKSIKREKLLGYWPIVRELRLEEKLTFRQISEYFEKYHKFEVSYSLIYQVWCEKNNKKKEENNG